MKKGKSSIYAGVSIIKTKNHGRDVTRYQAALYLPGGGRWISQEDSERNAAIAYDKKLISLGRPPVNILKPKQNV